VELEQRTWVPAMVPWRATDDGYVTEDLLAWYERFARGRPGALVVEATGIRDVPSGPLLRVGHDRFVPGLAELVRTVRRASGGHTRLFLQAIDFLTIRRRPEPETFFRRYLQLEDHHRAAFPGLADEEVRERLLAMSEDEEALADLLTDREMEALLYGYRERVTDLDLPHIAELPRALPGLFAGAAARAPTPWRRSSRRSTSATTATAARARTASGCRSRSTARCASASARASSSAAATSPRTACRTATASRTRCTSASSWRG